jgi:hypothetical protein
MKGFHKKMTPMTNEKIKTRLLVGVEINGQKRSTIQKVFSSREKKSLTIRTDKKVPTVFNSQLALVETSFRGKSG